LAQVAKPQGKITFVSNTSGNRKLWPEDAYKKNKRQLTHTPMLIM